ncbi:MAG: hypothetical protein NZ740_02415 [Kiritimatiellae bacterium]|nr:hypothetical protein [Kiritimatiellia bacterium]MDW8457946.1 hypothetical protein [Verrucomicrobiota bacterium]
MARTSGLFHGRWGAILGFAALVWMAWQIGKPPVVLHQRIDSPDGELRAFLERTREVHDHFRVRISGRGLTLVAYYSPPFTNDFRLDLGERLRWSADGARLFLQIGGRDVWRWDRGTRRGADLNPGDYW